MERGQMNTRLMIIVVVVVVIIAGVGIYLAISSGGGEQKKIHFGYANAVTGLYSDYEWPFKSGVEAAINLVNDTKPPLGREVVLHYEDTESTMEGGLEAAKKLVNVNNVVGEGICCSETSLGAVDWMKDRKIPFFTNAGGTVDLDKVGGEYQYRTVASDSYASVAYSITMYEEMDASDIVIIYTGERGPISEMEGVLSAFPALGGEIVKKIQITAEQPSYMSALNEAVGANPDAISIHSGFSTANTLIKNWNDMGKPVPIFLSHTLTSEEFIDSVGPEIMETKVWSSSPTSRIGTDAYDYFESNFVDYWDEDPQIFSDTGWDGALCFLLAVEKAGSTDSAEVAQAIRDVALPPGTEVYEYTQAVELLRDGEEIDFEGAASKLDFDEYGNVRSPAAVWEVDDGDWVRKKIISIERIEELLG
ncbi:hypothetical protein AKJ61_02615 [candidate division MSBL1 archaeon SCGC-AAA259B11]|uniref:Leucine-binding protein domain-containing protein n=1 Tax=candidate division MSBL1 archaeon SCGC-AAA259B11 TaxID=1698260 RepID=A0A133U5U4_9EURY|nr:hypothetical protein AKJ61_02615 [candidate division MSBL1 archaeon SCGC-AAA259B11]